MSGEARNNIAPFKAGETLDVRIHSGRLQALADAANRSTRQPGSFASGAHSVQRRLGATGSGGDVVNMARAIAITTFDPATGFSIDECGDGTYALINDDGSFDPDLLVGDDGGTPAKSEYFNSIPAGSNGRVVTTKGVTWFVTWGCGSG